MIYLDNAATTKIAPEVLDAMMPYLTDEYGNAGSLHKLGRHAAEAVQKAREQTASLLGCEPDHVIFTSGGSEGNSMVFSGLEERLKAEGKTHMVVSAIEHESVLRASQKATKHGFYTYYVLPQDDGKIAHRAVQSVIREDTGLVSVMYANNETGAVNNVAEINRVCKEQGILYHMDCVQAAGLYEIQANKHCDFATISSHKIHGPKGVGALYVRDKTLTPLISGGTGQEFGLRGGTENVAGIVGFGCACEFAKKNMATDVIRISAVRQRFYVSLLWALNDFGIDKAIVHVNGPSVVTPGKILNLRFDGIDGDTLMLMLDLAGVCVSTGSACRSKEIEPSHVLTAMGLTVDEARSSVRLSFSKYNTVEEADEAATVFARCIRTLHF